MKKAITTAVAVFAAALVIAAPAGAEPDDDYLYENPENAAFLHSLAKAGLVPENPTGTVLLGRGICQQVSVGRSTNQIATEIVANNLMGEPWVDMDIARSFVAMSVSHLCKDLIGTLLQNNIAAQ